MVYLFDGELEVGKVCGKGVCGEVKECVVELEEVFLLEICYRLVGVKLYDVEDGVVIEVDVVFVS